MANLFSGNILIVQAALAVASILFIGMGVALSNVAALKQYMSMTFPEEGLPYKHYSYRRNVGAAYIITGLLIAISIFLDITDEAGLLFPFYGLAVAFANSILSTTVILTLLYVSRNLIRVIMAEAFILAVLTAAFLLTSSMPGVREAIRYIWILILFISLVCNTFIYIRTRQRYLRMMFGVIGSEALDYSLPHITYLYLPSVVLSLLASMFCYPDILNQLVLVISLSGYYVVLALYYRRHSFDCAVVEEAMDGDFDWKRASDELWRKILRGKY